MNVSFIQSLRYPSSSTSQSQQDLLLASFIMLSSLIPLFSLLSTALAGPLLAQRLETRQTTQTININVQVSDAQFASFEDANTLETYLQSQGYDYAFNYTQLAQGVTLIEQYFTTKAAQTTTSSSNDGFFAPDTTAVQTTTDSTSLKGGPSYTNNSLSAVEDLVSAISFSDGDAGTYVKTSSSFPIILLTGPPAPAEPSSEKRLPPAPPHQGHQTQQPQ